MALLEELQRVAHKYNVLPKLILFLPYISFLCALLGAGWIFYLPIDGQYRQTYISENALMPSQAYSYYRESEWNLLRGYRDEISKMSNASIESRNAILKSYLADIGYTTATHEFLHLNGSLGNNIYGILNAPRGDGTEAMVLVAPWTTTDGEYNLNGVSLVMALARYFNRWTVWSKNIIVVFAQDNEFALRSWVKDYHSKLDLTGGSIEAALVVEYPGKGDYYDYLEIMYEGVNGQLPNLDLLNIAVSISEHEGMTVSLQHVPKDEVHKGGYWHRLKVLLTGVKELTLAGLKNSNGCEVFSGYRIQAITLRAMGESGHIDITTLGRVVEASFRSVNNLLEKFHQSFFFYLMLAPRDFISIGTYLPSAVILTISFALASLSEILNSRLSLQNLLDCSIKVCLVFLAIFASCSIIGSLILYIPTSASAFVFYLFLIIGLMASVLPTKRLLLANLAGYWGRTNEYNPLVLYASTAFTLHSMALLFSSLIITSILVVHFSLAYSISICMLPLTFVRPITIRSSKYQEQINSVSLLVSCPIFIVLVVGLLDPSLKTAGAGIALMEGLLKAWQVFDCWTWFIVAAGWTPAWISTAIIGTMLINESEYGVIDYDKKET